MTQTEQAAIDRAVRQFRHRSYRVPPTEKFPLWGNPTNPGYLSSTPDSRLCWEVRRVWKELPGRVSYTTHGSWTVVMVTETYYLRDGKTLRQVEAGLVYRGPAGADLCGWCGAINPGRTGWDCNNCGGN